MTSILKTLAVAMTLLGGVATLAGSALAGDNIYGWAYPENFKSQPRVPVQPLGGESGIPPLYR
jgi:hypothetical protein